MSCIHRKHDLIEVFSLIILRIISHHKQSVSLPPVRKNAIPLQIDESDENLEP